MKTFRQFILEKVEVPSKSKTLGIDRKDMPQIDSKHTSDFISYLKKNGVSSSKKRVDSNKLKATQHQFHKEKIQRLMDYMDDGTYDEKHILVSKDNYVMDGHHRWLAHKNTGKDINIHHVDTNAKDLIGMMHEYPKSYTKKLYEELNEETERVRYHGSPYKFTKFQTADVFLAKNKREAMRYGPHVYEVTYKGKPKFETNTIEVIKPDQVLTLKHIEHNPTQRVYRT